MAALAYQGSELPPDPAYPVHAELEFRLVLGPEILFCGAGRTVSVSKHTILLSATPVPPPDMEIEVDIAWPRRPEHPVQLQLCVTGRTQAGKNGHTAVQVVRSQFRALKTARAT